MKIDKMSTDTIKEYLKEREQEESKPKQETELMIRNMSIYSSGKIAANILYSAVIELYNDKDGYWELDGVEIDQRSELIYFKKGRN